MDTVFNIICLKWGDKYSAEYVNNLLSMVERHLSLPHRFVCLTDDTTDINPQVECLPLLEDGLEGWWNKLSIFREEVHNLKGPTVFLDLDVVIIDNIDFLFREKIEDKFVGVIDFIQPQKTFNSSVFRFDIGGCTEVYNRFKSELTRGGDGTYSDKSGNHFVGDQDWITYCLYPFGKHIQHAYSDGYVSSYKRSAMHQGRPLANTKIVVFHGNPNPHEVEDGWVKNNWTTT